jgi:hypothetical protein
VIFFFVSVCTKDFRPHHFDVGVCVIPTFFLEIFGAKKKFQNKTSGGHEQAWTCSRGSPQTLYMIIRDQVQQKNILKHHGPV